MEHVLTLYIEKSVREKAIWYILDAKNSEALTSIILEVFHLWVSVIYWICYLNSFDAEITILCDQVEDLALLWTLLC